MKLNDETRSRPVSRWVWVAAFMGIWTAALLWMVCGYLCDREDSVFLEKGRWTSRHYGRLLGDAMSTGEPVVAQSYIDQLAGELNARYALWTDAQGTVLSAAGSPPEEPFGQRLARAAIDAKEFQATEVPARPAFVEYAEPVWADPERRGILRWGVWLAPLEELKDKHRRSVMLSGMWLIGFGVLFSIWFSYREGQR